MFQVRVTFYLVQFFYLFLLGFNHLSSDHVAIYTDKGKSNANVEECYFKDYLTAKEYDE